MRRGTDGAPALARRVLVAILLFSMLGVHCSGGGDSTPPVASFEASPTANTPDLVRLAEVSTSGDTVTVSVDLTGLTTSQDIYGLAFNLILGDTRVAGLLPDSGEAGPALSDDGCEGISAQAVQNGDRIVVGVTKLGACAGNGVPDSETRSILSLVLRALSPGISSVRFETGGGQDPLALNSSGQPILDLVFDGESAHVMGE